MAFKSLSSLKVYTIYQVATFPMEDTYYYSCFFVQNCTVCCMSISITLGKMLKVSLSTISTPQFTVVLDFVKK